jgi:hypothetical protein
MTDLSPAAQSVLDVYKNAPDLMVDGDSDKVELRLVISATLRVAADQVVPVELEDKDLDFSNPDDKAEWYQWSQRQYTRHQLLAIATELDDL